ncbi:MAG: ribonuclease Z [Candidatus Bathyarchaeia archaeon]
MSDLQIFFLGTSGSVPTTDRSLPSIAVKRRGEILILDCGEGTQRQMVKAGLSFARKTKVFITHMHGDHIFGLPGLIQTMSLMNREENLSIYGPRGISAFIEAMCETANLHSQFEIRVFEVEGSGVVYEEKEYEVYACINDHIIPGFAYALVEKPRPGKFYPDKALALRIPEGPLWSRLQHGESLEMPDGRVINPEMVMGPKKAGRKIVYSGDSRPTEAVVHLAKNADVLIHEATFGEDLKERAELDGHSTFSEAAEVALRAGVKKLFLTHISARYRDVTHLLTEARRIFPNTEVASDLMKVEVPLPDD